MKEIVKWLPLIVILVIAFSVGTFFVVRFLRKIQAQKKGITIFGVTAISLGIGGSVIMTGVLISTFFPAFLEKSKSVIGMRIFSLFHLTLALLLFISGIGVLNLKNWGRRAILTQSVLSLVHYVYMLIIFILGARVIGIARITRSFPIYLTLFVIAFSLLVLWFFNRASVKAQFEHPLQKLE